MNPTVCQFDITRLHTTTLGIERIRRNLNLSHSVDVIRFCKDFIAERCPTIERKGKNWYVTADDVRLTVNACSLTIITAHKITQ